MRSIHGASAAEYGHRFLEMVVSTPSHATPANESKAKSVFRVVSGNFLEMYDFMDVTFSALKQKPPRHGEGVFVRCAQRCRARFTKRLYRRPPVRSPLPTRRVSIAGTSALSDTTGSIRYRYPSASPRRTAASATT